MNTISSANQVQKNNADSDSSLEVKNDVAYRDGFHFYYQYQDHTIHAFGSAVTGKEIVYLDDKIVAEKRSFGRKSCLSFEINTKSFEIEFNMVNLFTGELHCSLIQEGVHVKTFKRALKKKNHATLKNLTKCFFLGAGIGIGFTGTLVLGEVAGLWNIDTVISYFN